MMISIKKLGSISSAEFILRIGLEDRWLEYGLRLSEIDGVIAAACGTIVDICFICVNLEGLRVYVENDRFSGISVPCTFSHHFSKLPACFEFLFLMELVLEKALVAEYCTIVGINVAMKMRPTEIVLTVHFLILSRRVPPDKGYETQFIATITVLVVENNSCSGIVDFGLIGDSFEEMTGKLLQFVTRPLMWNKFHVPASTLYSWDDYSTYISELRYLKSTTMSSLEPHGANHDYFFLLKFDDSITTYLNSPTISINLWLDQDGHVKLTNDAKALSGYQKRTVVKVKPIMDVIFKVVYSLFKEVLLMEFFQGTCAQQFNSVLMVFGNSLNGNGHQVTFLDDYDFDYLPMLLACLSMCCNNLNEGLNNIGELFGVKRVGVYHLLGSPFITDHYFKIHEDHFDSNTKFMVSNTIFNRPCLYFWEILLTFHKVLFTKMDIIVQLAFQVLILERTEHYYESFSACLCSKELLWTNDTVLMDELSLDILQIVFQCYIHEYSFVTHQHIAIELNKVIGEDKFLLLAVYTIQWQVSCGIGWRKLLLLFGKLLMLHLTSHSLYEPEAVMVYVSIMEQQVNYEEVLKIFFGKLRAPLMIEVDKLFIHGMILTWAGNYVAGPYIFQEIFSFCPGDREAFLLYMGCNIEDDKYWSSELAKVLLHPLQFLILQYFIWDEMKTHSFGKEDNVFLQDSESKFLEDLKTFTSLLAGPTEMFGKSVTVSNLPDLVGNASNFFVVEVEGFAGEMKKVYRIVNLSHGRTWILKRASLTTSKFNS